MTVSPASQRSSTARGTHCDRDDVVNQGRVAPFESHDCARTREISMTTYLFPVPARPTGAARARSLAFFGALLVASSHALAQAPAATAVAAAPVPADELEKLVGRIALYPDDLVAIVLPAATNPLQIVQADRFLVKRKTDPKAAVDEKWDDAIKSLLNYPEVVTQMSGDLDWTAALGEAVVADQGKVLDAVQAFRRKTQAAGNLKSDPKQVIVVEKEVIKIVPADPQVIYVPQYNPSTVVVYGSPAPYAYYPTPYPVYYYPYPPGAAFATGLIWGAAISSAWNGNHYAAHYGGNANINVNRNTNINTGNTNINTGNINTGNINTGNINTGNANVGGGNRPTQTPASGTPWKSSKQPGQVSKSVGATPPARVGDARPASTSAAARSSSVQPVSTGSSASRSPSASRAVPSTTAFDGYGSGSQAKMDSSRGAASRGSAAPAARQGGGGRTRR
ncbi:MAG: DUF3300 domain-containing protein [Chitinophagaceae bacterium]|nr:DUF3300 domain-containing protein [Rubrivivax sp.]